jgi:hypothetical protein
MKNVMLVALLALSGCATSAAGLGRTNVEMTVTSQKPSQAFATCVAEALIGNNQLRNEGDHYWILRFNGYGIAVSRWDFKPNPAGGSIAELRATISINTGDERVKACA